MTPTCSKRSITATGSTSCASASRTRAEDGTTVAEQYAIDDVHVTLVVPFGKQAGLSLGLESRGTVTTETYDGDGNLVARSSAPFATSFVMGRPTGGRWMNVAVAARGGIMSDPLRFGVLGCAAIAVHKVIPAIHRSERCEVVAIASRDADRAAATATDLGIGRHHGSYDDLLADPDVEAVYIPLPNHLHAPWTRRAAEAGKHVLCEKPLALDTAEAAGMIEGCRRADVVLMEAFMYRVHPLWTRVHELVTDGTIGELQAIQAFFSYRNLDPENIRNIAAYGGGALMDIGCYPINVARWLFGAEPSDVVGSVRFDPTFGTDVLSSAVLDFGGRHATFTCSTQLEDDQRVHLIGSEGRLLVEIPFNIPPDRPTRIIRAAGGDPPVAPGLDVITIPPADPYAVQADAFAAAVRDGAPVPIPPEDAIGTLAVIERILDSASQRQP